MDLLTRALVFVTFLSVSCGSTEDYSQCGESHSLHIASRIFNGDEASYDQWPWHAPIVRQKDDSYFCGSTLISDRHVLTAAHCLQLNPDSPVKSLIYFKILLGGLNLNNASEWTVRYPSKITIHPDWRKNQKNFDADVAIVELDQPVTFSKSIRRICLPECSDLEFSTMGTVVGHGITETGCISNISKVIEIPTMSLVDCLFKLPDYAKVMSKKMFCAGSEGRIPCTGDSGSGFSVKEGSEQWTIYGIVSLALLDGDGKCNSSKPSAFTHVPAFMKWIHDTAFNNSGGCKELPSKCSTLKCQYGIAKSKDPNTGREMCECDDPCAGHSCPEGTRCFIEQSLNEDEEEFAPVCHKISKPGVCASNFTQNVRKKLFKCTDDADCSGNRKCCQYRTFSMCRLPLFPPKIYSDCQENVNRGFCPTKLTQNVTNLFTCSDDADCSEDLICCFNTCLLPQLPPKIGGLIFSALNISADTYGSVILKCPVSGYPEPTITWTRNGEKVGDETGRYVLPSNGDLQIQNLKMADAGTYVCTASNGFGWNATKEFTLTVLMYSVRGLKNDNEFELVNNSKIDACNYTLRADQDDQVEIFRAKEIPTVQYLPIGIGDKFPNLYHYEVIYCNVKEIRKENFENLGKLEVLNLWLNKIAAIEEKSFDKLTSLNWLSLASNQIKSVPENLFQKNIQLEYLDLRDNRLQFLPSKTLENLLDLKQVYFSKNHLQNINKTLFLNNKKLEMIWLDDNQIEHIDGDTFLGLSLLKFVDLRGNNCTNKAYGETKRNIFKSLATLNLDLDTTQQIVREVIKGKKENRDLSFLDEIKTFYTFVPFKNTTIETRTYKVASDRDDKVTAFIAEMIDSISYLPINTDEKFSNLIYYKVSVCSVREIRKENLKNLKKLEVLDLYRNKITSIDKNVFEDLVALKDLDLSFNQLTSLHEETFKNNQALQELHFYRNQLESLPSKFLQNLGELKIINLVWNNLKTLDADFFAHNLKLEHIELGKNQIEHLSANIFTKLNLLQVVNLEDNKCISGLYGNKNYEYTNEYHLILSFDLAQNCSRKFA